MNDAHRLLLRLLKKSGLSDENMPNDKESWLNFLQRINQSFNDYDADRTLVEKALELSSKEMRQRYEESEYLLHKEIFIFEEIIKNVPFIDICKYVLEIAEDQIDGMKASILMVNKESNTLSNFYAPNLPVEYCKLIDNIPIGDNNGSCGTAAFQKKPVIVSNIKASPLWKHIYPKVNRFNFFSCWSFPLMHSTNNVFGTLAFYFNEEKDLTTQFEPIIQLCVNILCVAYDYAEKQKLLETERLKLEIANKMATLGEMASGMAHEINNPLSVIYGNCQMMVKHINKNDKDTIDLEKMRHYCEGNIKVVDRITKIIKGLKNFSRDGTLDPFEKTTLQSIIDDTLIFCESKFKYQNIDFKVTPIDINLSLECRAVEISQVILNLLTNAADAIENITLKWISLEVKNDNHFIYISIIDSGNGIPLSVQEKMFNPFYTTKKVGKGTGLGLSICLGIIKDHNGTIKVDNNCPNSKIDIVLPIKMNPL